MAPLFGFGEKLNPLSFPAVLGSPVNGKFVPMEKIQDKNIAEGVLGKCCGIEPSDGNIYAPCDAKVSQVTETKHAIGLENNGVEILIHVGLKTVGMKGEGFTGKVKLDQIVKKGDLLIVADLWKIKNAGHPATVVMAVANSDDFSAVETIASGDIKAGQDILKVSK